MKDNYHVRSLLQQASQPICFTFSSGDKDGVKKAKQGYEDQYRKNRVLLGLAV